ncbi:MAG: pectinesterase family protein [Paludibacter sp.]|nr:pectinesterase family protein [Paludibacter sp.]
MKRFTFILMFSYCIMLNITAINRPFHANIVVALDGTGDYIKIQDAINAVPSNSSVRTLLFIKNGLYNTEKLIIPADKKNITFLGEDRDKTIVSYHIYDCKEGGPNNKCPAEDVAKWTGDVIRTSATLTVYGDGFHAENITFQNTAGAVGQALAITVCSDKNIFTNCSFLGYQDTMYLMTAGKRSYFYNCLVKGRTDYIYGAGIAYFDACEIRSFGGGWITAPSTPQDQPYGYVFSNCKLTFITGSPRPKDDTTKIALGRPWHNYPKVAWLYCDMCKEINPLGWPTTWHMEYAATITDLHLYEYKNTGSGASMNNRAKWAGLRALTDSEVKDYSVIKVMAGADNWNPLKDIVRKKK